MGMTKPENRTETKLKRIAELSAGNEGIKFKWLMQHFNEESLRQCFNELEGNKAVGADGIAKEEYGINLTENLRDLIKRMKRMGYRPGPVRETLIPKEGRKGALRPLGISNFEDKIVQGMTKKTLEAIYEPIFLDCSYGFRPGISCHDAIRALHRHLFENEVQVVIDVDLENFFGTIQHPVLLELLKRKIEDERFLRYLVRMLKAGVLSQGELCVTEEGTPQGSLCSPILANIVAHYVIDEWFSETVKKHVRGSVELFRYCDDLVICCRYKDDAERIKVAMDRRLGKYGLKLNQEKSRLVKFSKNDMFFQNEKQGVFDFLGFTFHLGWSRKGYVVPKARTSSKRLRSKLQKVKQWCRANRCKVRMKPLWEQFRIKLEGHIRYYGVSGNSEQVSRFLFLAVFTFFKWMNRRSQKKSMNWKQFYRFLKQYPPPKGRVIHSLYVL